MAMLQGLLPDLVALSRQAGREILAVYNTNFEVQHKADHSPLTLADLAAHRTIVAGLKALTPDIPILSEEESDIGFATRSTWQRHWLVDPLDGTKEFVSRNGEFTVNIALIEAHVPVLGVVHVPTTDVTYGGATGGGAFKQLASRPAQPIRVSRPPPVPLRVTGSRSHSSDSTDRFAPVLGPYTLIKVGSSVKFCLIAEGAADLYPRMGPTSEWDTAAGQAVLEAAGGGVSNLEGQRLQYNSRELLTNPHFIAYGDDSRNWCELLRRL